MQIIGSDRCFLSVNRQKKDKNLDNTGLSAVTPDLNSKAAVIPFMDIKWHKPINIAFKGNLDKEDINKKLQEAKTLDGGKDRFDRYEIDSIQKSINEDNIDYFDALFDAKTIDGKKYRWNGYALANILGHINEYNKEFLPDLLDAKTIDGTEYRFEFSDIINILEDTNKKNAKYIPALLNAKTEDDKEYRFEGIDLLKILSLPDEDIKSIISKPLKEINLEKLISFVEEFKDFIKSNMYRCIRDKETSFTKDIKTAIIDKAESIKPFDSETIEKIDNSINNLDESIPHVDLERFARTGLPLSEDKKHIDLNQIPDELKSQYKPLFDDLNVIIESFPEFAETIGRKQHGKHAYTLDIHMLKALQEALNDPGYKSLPDKDRKIAKYAILFHDIEKKEGMADPEHPENSASTVYGMIRKLDMPIRDIERITGLVRNHHWLEKIAERKISDEDAAFSFRRPKDFDIAKIFAGADLKAVGNGFGDRKLQKLEETIPDIQRQVDKINSTGIFLPQTVIPKASEIKKRLMQQGNLPGVQEIDGNIIVKIDKKTKFEESGFKKGTDYNNFRAIVHAISDDNTNITKDIAYAGMEGKNGCFSASYISPQMAFTYRNSGLVFDIDNHNIAIASNKNLDSGLKKNLESFKEFVFAKDYKSFNNRIDFSKKFKELGGLDNSQYLEKYKELSQYQSLTDIKDENSRKLVDNVVNETMFDNSRKNFNEVVVYAPKPVGVFSKESSPEKIPHHLRLYAKEHDLPIIIFDEPTKS